MQYLHLWKCCRLMLISVSKSTRRYHTSKHIIDIAPEVSNAVINNLPIVALESTIISHGMPYPQNEETAIKVEDIIRKEGAVPATIAIINGRIKVGLSSAMLSEFASSKTPILKVSRRDFPYVLSKGLSGGTTVSGTMIVADLVGIKVFVSGGIGGVHRGGETTFDVSTDLTELGRTPVCVVTSGVKSILDIAKTLEYLETQGVCVATYGASREFPSFYTPGSGIQAPYNVETPAEAAELILSIMKLKLNSGMLLAVPVPENEAMGGEIDEAIRTAVRDAESQGITGKEVTPFLLSRVASLTSGKSLQSNIALIKNNAKVGAQVAVELQKRTTSSYRKAIEGLFHIQEQVTRSSHIQYPPTPVIIGGSVLDFTVCVTADTIRRDGSTHRGEIWQTGGGVGRNIADALGKLGARPFFISAVGDDQFGQFLLEQTLDHLDVTGVSKLRNHRTACYNVVLDKNGSFQYGVGDMKIHDLITPDMVQKYASRIQHSPLVVVDGNIPEDTVDYVLSLCQEHQVPVWFEPTDLMKARKPFRSSLWKTLKFVSPNINELLVMAEAAGLTVKRELVSSTCSSDHLLKEVATLSALLVDYVNTVIVTMGKRGLMVVKRAENAKTCQASGRVIEQTKVTAHYYPVTVTENIHSVSGAGDCFASAFIAGILRGLPEQSCVAAGIEASKLSLSSAAAVPKVLTLNAWNLKADYIDIL